MKSNDSRQVWTVDVVLLVCPVTFSFRLLPFIRSFSHFNSTNSVVEGGSHILYPVHDRRWASLMNKVFDSIPNLFTELCDRLILDL